MSKFKTNYVILCAKYFQIFLSNSEDFRHTDLVTMGMEIKDSPPISQRIYDLYMNIVLRFREIEMLGNTRIILFSVFPWTSPIGVILK